MTSPPREPGTTRRSLALVSGGLSVPSATRLLADHLGAATARALRELGVEPSTTVVDLRDIAHDITNAVLTGFPSAALRAATEPVGRADGLVLVTPIFNASYSGLFKSFVDVLDEDALVGRPVLLAATGGTPRHSLALEHAMRPLFAHLRAVTVPTAVFAATEDWGSAGAATSALGHRVDRAGRELAALVAQTAAPRPVDPFEDPTPFGQLLGET